MDKFDLLINNRAPRKCLFFFIVVLLVSLVTAWFSSAFIADLISEYIIKSSISSVGGGKITALPNNNAIIHGEYLLSEYNIKADISPRLMECWEYIRLISFFVILGIILIISTLWLAFSLHSLFRVYNQIEKIRDECIIAAENADFKFTLMDDNFSCIRRLSESLRLISERLSFLNDNLQNEKDFLKEFLTDLSHQLKTSLAVIRLNTDLLCEIEHISYEKKIVLSDEIQLNLDGMENLVFNAIKLAKFNANAISYSMNQTDISDTCKETVKRITPLLREKNISLTFIPDKSVSFIHDRIWLCEAFENIIKNSIDHSECSEISMKISSNPAVTTVTITDNGIGIPQHQIPELFTRFGKKSNNPNMTNSGIGMSISKKIIQAHHGEIIVYSNSHNGTDFEISFLNI